MIYTVTLNPSIDYVAVTEQFSTGGMNRTEKEACFPGGKGINVSAVLHTLGIDSVILGFSAGFTGTEIERQLGGMGLHTDFVRLSAGMNRINVKIKALEETELNGAGPEVCEADMEVLKQKVSVLKAGDYLVLSGNAPKGLPDAVYRELAENLPKGVRLVVDAEKKLLLPTLPQKPFLIKPNRMELEAIFDVRLETTEMIVEYAKKLQQMGAENVLVSLAEDGAVLLTQEGKVIRGTAPKGRVSNSVGAGDSMLAGFLSAAVKGESAEKALQTGLAAGSASAFSMGLADTKAVEELLEVCYTF